MSKDDHTLDALRYLVTGLDQHADRTGWGTPPPAADNAALAAAAPPPADRGIVLPPEAIWGE